eukprot:TRINITY_DN5647_c0_g1_i1.p1 TRINITY_DN5647_c0_g1~~TRINITY_DN5647_c0_g1_i1.p1  ORF type:complete len:728 (-),score=123.56 TRINITY_DN5647_c0_g1_i1:87-2270(-)
MVMAVLSQTDSGGLAALPFHCRRCDSRAGMLKPTDNDEDEISSATTERMLTSLDHLQTSLQELKEGQKELRLSLGWFLKAQTFDGGNSKPSFEPGSAGSDCRGAADRAGCGGGGLGVRPPPLVLCDNGTKAEAGGVHPPWAPCPPLSPPRDRSPNPLRKVVAAFPALPLLERGPHSPTLGAAGGKSRLDDILGGVPEEPPSPTSPSHRGRKPKLMRKAFRSQKSNSWGDSEEHVVWDRIVSTDSKMSKRTCITTMSDAMPRLELKRSRSSFEAFRTEEEDKVDLRNVFLHAEHLDESQNRQIPLRERFQMMRRAHVEIAADSVIGFIIVVNAIFIGVSIDAPASWQTAILGMDLFFSTAFILELGLKLYVNGMQQQFFGENRLMNWFDAALIFIDLLQMALQLVMPEVSDGVGDLPSASLFRVVRLVRLVRILRLLRHPALQTLLMMMHGMIGGLPTLGWALLLFIFSVYIVALLCREFLGRAEHEGIYEYFNNVPRAMITAFRCSFGECDSIDGTPIFESVDAKYGMGFSILYCLFAFTMSIGMFNVISAIFVQSTMAAATAMKAKQKKARLQDEDLWASRVSTIVRKMLSFSTGHGQTGSLSEMIDIIYDLDISSSALEIIGSDSVVRCALEDLDVDPEDHEYLSDILDVEQEGHIAIIELLQGVRRLRGNPRRSDIVTVDLICRSMQNSLKDIKKLLQTVAENTEPPQQSVPLVRSARRAKTLS